MAKRKCSTTANTWDAAEIADQAKDAGVTVEELPRIKETYKYPICLMLKFIEDFFKGLERDKHYIYTTILHLPEANFRILKYYDRKVYRQGRIKKDGSSGYIPEESYSLKSFYEMRKSFHRLDEFTIFVFSESFDRERVITQEKVERLYLRFLREQCEAALRQDKQIQLTPEIISEYGLTDDDVDTVRKYLNRFNFEARNKIQKELNALKNLSFLKK